MTCANVHLLGERDINYVQSWWPNVASDPINRAQWKYGDALIAHRQPQSMADVTVEKWPLAHSTTFSCQHRGRASPLTAVGYGRSTVQYGARTA